MSHLAPLGVSLFRNVADKSTQIYFRSLFKRSRVSSSNNQVEEDPFYPYT